ncbi:trimeric intracellular cation channel family protein [Altererythrobacter sp. CC-YST694]|uniref:trimeric intracellular cation channel family protein n=1 Tax=Altererythrobacter sp. CC-YST694 TaxID=2755038 RepID=UPI001D02B2F9|nr:trimeric intracellular cation channel family protein [Altererythrobacter sp. CC-YST694]MCB5424157.1 trimeric intracellular cation channel family protein [Altererythrobacter sp. CC-YST694]
MTSTTIATLTLPPALDLAGVAVFALSGALQAARMRQTIVTMGFFALVTGVGGGSVRDVLLGVPAFWLHDPWIAPAILAMALLAWFTPHRWWDGQLLEWLDAAGLAVFSVLGTAKALSLGAAPVPAAILGIVTGCVGGIIRDVLAGVPSIVMRPEIYVTAAALSAALCAAGMALNINPPLVWGVAGLAGFLLRGAALRWGLNLPAYSRSGNQPPEPS